MSWRLRIKKWRKYLKLLGIAMIIPFIAVAALFIGIYIFMVFKEGSDLLRIVMSLGLIAIAGLSLLLFIAEY